MLAASHRYVYLSEFVGVDVLAEGNQPVEAKATTLKTWKYPIIVRDIVLQKNKMEGYTRS